MSYNSFSVVRAIMKWMTAIKMFLVSNLSAKSIFHQKVRKKLPNVNQLLNYLVKKTYYYRVMTFAKIFPLFHCKFRYFLRIRILNSHLKTQMSGNISLIAFELDNDKNPDSTKNYSAKFICRTHVFVVVHGIDPQPSECGIGQLNSV